MEKTKTLNTCYIVICKDSYETEYWVYETLEEAEEFFRGAVKNALERDDEETDANGRTVEECVHDGEADFGDLGIVIKTGNLWN